MSEKNLSPGDIVDADDIVPSSAALVAWSETTLRAAMFCHSLEIAEKDLPEEQVRLEADGSLTLFVVIQIQSGGQVTFDLTVPPSEWRWK